MASLLHNLEWLNHNASRKYPLTADATSLDQSGDFELPNDFLVALYLAVPVSVSVEPSRFYLRTLDISGVGFGIVIGYDDPSGAFDVAGASIARASFAVNQVYRLTGVGDFYDVTGHLMLGHLDNLDLQPTGRYTFDPDGGRLEPDCIRPMLRGISGVRVQNGNNISELVFGDITLNAGPNTLLTQSGNQITFSAVAGENLNEPCACDDAATLGDPILTINGQGPDASGNIPILGDECLEIVLESGGIRIIDNCSKPCCGCAELEVLTRELERSKLQLKALEQLSDLLNQRTEQMDRVVLGSRLNDQPCFDCSSQLSSTTPDSTTTTAADPPLPMLAAPEPSCPDCVLLLIPETTGASEDSPFAAEALMLTGSDAIRSGAGEQYVAAAVNWHLGTLQLLAVNDDVAVYRAELAGMDCLWQTFVLEESTGVRVWPETLTLSACA